MSEQFEPPWQERSQTSPQPSMPPQPGQVPPYGYGRPASTPPPGYGPGPVYGPPPGYGPPQPYGLPVPPGYVLMPYPAQQAPTNNGLCVAGFVTGLCGLVLFWVPVIGFLLAGTGVVLSAVGMSQGKKTGRPTGLGVAGLVLGILGVLAFLLIVVSLG